MKFRRNDARLKPRERDSARSAGSSRRSCSHLQRDDVLHARIGLLRRACRRDPARTPGWGALHGEGSRLTGPLRRGLVRAVVVQKPIVAGMAVLFGALTVWSTVGAQAPSVANIAGAGAPAEQARQILQAVEADESARELVSRALNQAHSTLDQASYEPAPERRAALEAMALEWAQTARDLKRARDAEQASDQLEQSLSALQTELVRTRASVEQALARVGRARQALRELERSKSAGAAPAGAARP